MRLSQDRDQMLSTFLVADNANVRSVQSMHRGCEAHTLTVTALAFTITSAGQRILSVAMPWDHA